MKKDNKLRIEVINKYFYPVSAGIEVNILNTIKYFLNAAKITVVTSKDTLNKKNTLKDKDSVDGINIKRYKDFSKMSLLSKISWEDIDILDLHNFNVFPHFYILFYCLLLKITGAKKFTLILSPHGGFTPEWTVFPPLQRLIKKSYHTYLGTLLINLVVDKVRAISEWERQELINIGVKAKLIKVIPNGIEDNSFKNVDDLATRKIKHLVKKLDKYIIQVGRIHPIKNYETTILALPEIDSSVKYVIVGPLQDLEYKKYLNHLIKKLYLSKRVIFTGVITGVDKYYLLQKAQMMVHMALWESYCNVVHEGLSQGLPCIVANNTALPFLIKDRVNGFLVNTKDSISLAERINYILKNKNSKTIENMETNNKKIFRKRTWKEVSSELYKFFTIN